AARAERAVTDLVACERCQSRVQPQSAVDGLLIDGDLLGAVFCRPCALLLLAMPGILPVQGGRSSTVAGSPAACPVYFSRKVRP
ncbi:MAG TPA: hypothetical protein VFH61_18525, partial [Thermoleophilia bacterium]|nr:hypothetical protein [Thermoleophilia bacterium]